MRKLSERGSESIAKKLRKKFKKLLTKRRDYDRI